MVLAGSVSAAIVRHQLALPKAEDDFQLVKVADGVYAAIAKPGGLASGNAGFVIGDDGVLIFDTFFTPVALEELIGEIQILTKLRSSSRSTVTTISITRAGIRCSPPAAFRSSRMTTF